MVYTVVIISDPAATGFYTQTSFCQQGLAFCENDLSLPCTPLQTTVLSPNYLVFTFQFLTDNVVYLTGVDMELQLLIMYPCTAANTTSFTDCQTASAETDTIKILVYPANKGENAYAVYTEDAFTQNAMDMF